MVVVVLAVSGVLRVSGVPGAVCRGLRERPPGRLGVVMPASLVVHGGVVLRAVLVLHIVVILHGSSLEAIAAR